MEQDRFTYLSIINVEGGVSNYNILADDKINEFAKERL